MNLDCRLCRTSIRRKRRGNHNNNNIQYMLLTVYQNMELVCFDEHIYLTFRKTKGTLEETEKELSLTLLELDRKEELLTKLLEEGSDNEKADELQIEKISRNEFSDLKPQLTATFGKKTISDTLIQSKKKLEIKKGQE